MAWMVKNLPVMREIQVRSLGWEDLLEKGIATTRDFPGGSEGKASVYNVGDLGLIPGSGDPLEKEMAAHSSSLACKIPWMEGPGGLQSMGLQRVRHD